MTTGISGSQNFNTNVQDAGKTAGSSPSSATYLSSGARSDSLNSADATQSYVPPDIDPISSLPKLPLPTDAKAQTPQETLNETIATPDQVYSDKLRQILGQLAEKNTKLSEQVYFVLTHPGATLPKEFKKALEFAEQFQQQATSYVKNTTGNNSFTAPKPDTARANEEFASQINAQFESLVSKNTILTPQEKANVLLAYYHPKLVDKGDLSKNELLTLDTATIKAQSLFDKTGAVPKGFNIPKSSADFDMKNSYNFAQTFQEAAESTKPPLTQQEVNFLRFKLNHPNDPSPPLPPGKSDADMKALFNKTFQTAQQQFSKETGFPANYTPDVNSEVYDALLLGSFEEAFEAQLKNQSPPLTDAQKSLLRTALGQQASNIPKEIQALFEMIKGSALAEVIKAFDLPPAWNPKTRNLNDPAVIQQRAQIEMQMNGVKAAQEMVASLQSVVNQMPDGPTKVTYSIYLKAVGEALNKFAESMLESSAADSDAARKLTIATRDAEKDRIKHQQHDVDEARKKEKKAAKMNAILGAIMAIFTGGLGIAMFIQKQLTGTNFFENLVKQTMEAIDKIVGDLPGLRALLKALANIAIFVVAFAMGPGYAVMTQLPERINSIIADIFIDFGISKDKAQMAAMIISTVLFIVAEILIMILTGGAAAGSLVGSFSQIATTISEIAKVVAKAVLKALKSLQSFLTEVATVMHKLSKAAQGVFQKLRTAATEMEQLMHNAQRAVSKAKNAPLAEKAERIATAQKAVAKLSDKLQETQELTAQFARQLRSDAIGNPELAKIAESAAKQAKKLQKVADEVAGMSSEISRAAASGSKSAQKLEKNIDLFIKGFSIASVSLTVVSTAVNVGREILLGQVARIKAEMEADNITIRALIKQIRAIIEALISGLSTSTETVKRIQETQANKFPDFNFVC